MEQQEKKGFNLWEALKKGFFILIFIQIFSAMVPKLKKNYQEYLNPKTKVSIIDVNGMISFSNNWIKEIRHAIKEEDIKAILVRINSGGGNAGSSELVFRELLRAKKDKPVFALIENIGASGAYFIAAAADKIICQETSIVGSVGVLSMHPSIKRFAESHNIDVEVLKKGDFKTAGSMLTGKMTDAERQSVQAVLDQTYESFSSLVAKQRGLDTKLHKNWADGRIFTGSQALKLGLVDKVGDLGDVEQEIKEKLGLKKAEIDFVRYPSKGALAKMLSGSDEESGSTPEGLPASFFKNVFSFVFPEFLQSGFRTL